MTTIRQLLKKHYVGCYKTPEEAAEAADYFLLELEGANARWKLNDSSVIDDTVFLTCNRCKQKKHWSDIKPPTGTSYQKLFCYKCLKAKHKETYEKQKAKTGDGKSPSQVYRTSLKGYLSFLLSCAKSRTKSRSYDCRLTYEDLLGIYNEQSGLCALSGKTMTWGSGEGRVKTHISIDRIDNKLGYTKDNVQLVCDFVNNMKSTLTNQELIEWCQAIATTSEIMPL